MLSASLASGVACIIKYLIASKFIWGKKGKKSNEPDYEWISFYRGLPWQKRWKQLIAKIVNGFAGISGKTLDVGCGSSPCGVLTNHSHYVGLDFNQSKVDYMKAKGLKDCEFIHGSMFELPFEENHFDTTLCIEVIEHTETWLNAWKSIKELARVTRHGGTVIIATPNFGSFTGQVQDKLYGIFQPKAYADEHNVKFTPKKLISTCQEYGLRFVESKIPMNSDMICKFVKE